MVATITEARRKRLDKRHNSNQLDNQLQPEQYISPSQARGMNCLPEVTNELVRDTGLSQATMQRPRR